MWADARQPDSIIAKKIGLKREIISYRIKRLEKKEIIKNYITLVDTAKLGYITFHIYLRLRKFDDKKEEEIIGTIKKDPFVKWLVSISGQYDLFFVMIARSREEFDSQLTRLYKRFEEHIADSEVLSTIKILKDAQFFYPGLKTDSNPHLQETVELQPGKTIVRLQDIDCAILDLISTDARMNTVDIASRLKKQGHDYTPEAISYRLKKLKKENIIRGYRAVLDYSRLGYLWYKLLISLRRIPEELEMQIREYVRQNHKVIYSDKMLGKWNIKIELLVKDHIEFNQELRKIRNLIGNYLTRYELIMIFGEHSTISYTKGICKQSAC